MLRNELQLYFDKVYPNSRIEAEHSLGGNIHIRFELGGDESFKIYRNGVEFEWWKNRRKMTKADKNNKNIHAKKRVDQATARGTKIFKETFSNSDVELWIIIYEYFDGLFNSLNDYLINQLPLECLRQFYSEIEDINTQMITTDEHGIDSFEKVKARVIIGRVKVSDIKIENIINGIANNEMGFEPNIAQNIYFFDPTTDRAFYMYDDRGCYVWSDQSDKIRDLYNNLKDWIVNFHREEIDKYFQ
jgi:Domain of unknown function (DUF3885)